MLLHALYIAVRPLAVRPREDGAWSVDDPFSFGRLCCCCSLLCICRSASLLRKAKQRKHSSSVTETEANRCDTGFYIPGTSSSTPLKAKINREVHIRNRIKSNQMVVQVTAGSMWDQDEEEEDDEAGAKPVEKYLVKWSDMSYLHVSWETAEDLIELTTGHVKSQVGVVVVVVIVVSQG